MAAALRDVSCSIESKAAFCLQGYVVMRHARLQLHLLHPAFPECFDMHCCAVLCDLPCLQPRAPASSRVVACAGFLLEGPKVMNKHRQQRGHQQH